MISLENIIGREVTILHKDSENEIGVVVDQMSENNIQCYYVKFLDKTIVNIDPNRILHVEPEGEYTNKLLLRWGRKVSKRNVESNNRNQE